MKRVKLKDKSPEFADEISKAKQTRQCEAPGCVAMAEFRAPKDRGLSDYYYFCQAHVSAYNQAWDFFDGMSESDIAEHVRSSMMGDRPTWKYAASPDMEDNLRQKARDFYGSDEAAREERTREQKEQEKQAPPTSPLSPEGQALEVLGLSAPITLDDIKKRYKELAKRYHPDRNPDKSDAEELLKSVNMAYTVLKVAYEKYERLIQK